MTRNRASAKKAGSAFERSRASVRCGKCGESRLLLNPKTAGEMCRTCASLLGSEAAREINTQDQLARFMALVSQTQGGCWLWRGTCQTNGYGAFGLAGKTLRAHRWSYEYFVGPIPRNLQIDHLCRVRNCVNPEHLEPVTARENTRRAMRTHCKNGHEFTPENTYTPADGKRYCRSCRRVRVREYQERKKL